MEILAGFSQGIGGFIAALIFSYIRKIRIFKSLGGRKPQIIGSWRGEAKQYSSEGNVLEYRVDMDLSTRWRRVVGRGQIAFTLDEEVITQRFRVTDGGFVHDQYLRLDYVNDNDGEEKRQFGYLVGLLNHSGDEIHATYAGIGNVFNEPSTGRFTFVKRTDLTT